MKDLWPDAQKANMCLCLGSGEILTSFTFHLERHQARQETNCELSHSFYVAIVIPTLNSFPLTDQPKRFSSGLARYQSSSVA
jgi:hypothetical protein